MKITVQVVLHADDDSQTVVREVFTLTREALAPDTVGLQLQEAKDLLAAVQDTLVEHQVRTALSAQAACPDCGTPHRHKDSRRIVMRTLFGVLRLDSPRWWSCPGTPRTVRTFSPLAAVLRERTTPELSYLQARFAGLVSYGLSADLLNEILPLGRVLHATTLRRQVQATAQRLENELGDEQPGFITGSPADWAELPRPDLPLVVGLDGGLRPLLHPTDPAGRLVRGDRRQDHAREMDTSFSDVAVMLIGVCTGGLVAVADLLDADEDPCRRRLSGFGGPGVAARS
jgi:hypothetical protein